MRENVIMKIGDSISTKTGFTAKIEQIEYRNGKPSLVHVKWDLGRLRDDPDQIVSLYLSEFEVITN